MQQWCHKWPVLLMSCVITGDQVCSELSTLQVGCLPVVHGSALVSAGSSQASLSFNVLLTQGQLHESCENSMDRPMGP